MSDPLRTIRDCAVEIAALAETHQTPAMRKVLASISDQVWSEMVVVLRYPNDDWALQRAIANRNGSAA